MEKDEQMNKSTNKQTNEGEKKLIVSVFWQKNETQTTWTQWTTRLNGLGTDLIREKIIELVKPQEISCFEDSASLDSLDLKQLYP